MEKLEYSIIIPILNMNQFTTVPKVKDLFVILTDLTRFLLSFVCWSFQVLGETTMDKRIRSSKTLSLGMPKVPQGNTQVRLASKLGDAPEGIPSFVYNLSVTHLELYFYSSHDMSSTWSILSYSFVCFNFATIIVCWTHLFERDTHLSWFVSILYVLHLYLLS